MRISALAIAMALFAQPAWAHHKPNHPDPRDTQSVSQRQTGSVERDVCGVSHNPHEPAGFQAMAMRCRGLLEASRARPDDAALRQRCDRVARSSTGRSCAPRAQSRDR